MIVWKSPDAPVSKMGSHMTMPSASAILKNSQSKSSLWMQRLPRPPMSDFTHAMQPVQWRMSRSCARMNSTSQPSSAAPMSASLQMESLLPFLVPNEMPSTFAMPVLPTTRGRPRRSLPYADSVGWQALCYGTKD